MSFNQDYLLKMKNSNFPLKKYNKMNKAGLPLGPLMGITHDYYPKGTRLACMLMSTAEHRPRGFAELMAELLVGLLSRASGLLYQAVHEGVEEEKVVILPSVRLLLHSTMVVYQEVINGFDCGKESIWFPFLMAPKASFS